MQKLNYISAFVILIFITNKIAAQQTLSDSRQSATAPRLSTNHKGQPVVSWVERNDKNDVVGFYFATSVDGGETFAAKYSVPLITGVSTHAEGMPKVAFKADGTIVAAYEARRPTPESRFAGNIYYRMSTDDGLTWSAAQFVHTDTTAGQSRSFFDMTALPNGEIGISWLGERPSAEGGRPVRFAQTTPGKGFGTEMTAKEGACQCCRTNLFVDQQRQVHIFFRDILEGGIRDIGHVKSANGGAFQSVGVVYNDQWRIDGCPHTGPSTAQLETALYTAWYTGAESGQGIKVSSGDGHLLTYIDNTGAQHPQIASDGQSLALAWDQRAEDGSTRLCIRRLTAKGQEGKDLWVTAAEDNAVLPSLLFTGKYLLIAYEAGNAKKRQVRWQRVLWQPEVTKQKR
jgi:hypothetical protein